MRGLYHHHLSMCRQRWGCYGVSLRVECGKRGREVGAPRRWLLVELQIVPTKLPLLDVSQTLLMHIDVVLANFVLVRLLVSCDNTGQSLVVYILDSGN